MTPWFALLRQFRTLRAVDQRRAGVPGEHWAALAAALGVWRSARRVRSPALRLLTMVAGGALVLRAVSGRDGALEVARRKAREARTVDGAR